MDSGRNAVGSAQRDVPEHELRPATTSEEYHSVARRLARRAVRGNLLSVGLLAALAYALLAWLYYRPMSFDPAASIAGRLDSRENYWNLWWVDKALLHEHVSPFFTPDMQYPFGISLLFHTLNVANGVLSLPFQALGGVAFAYNMVNLLALLLAAVGMFALARYVTGSSVAAFVAGLIYAFSPYVAFHIDAGQTNLVAVEWVPWYLLALLLGLRRHWAWLLAAAVLLLANALTDWHYCVFLALITAITAVYEALRLRRPRAVGELLLKLAAMSAVFVVLVSPVLVPMLSELGSDTSALRDLENSLNHSADVLAFLLPSPFHPLWGEWAGAILTGRLMPPHMVGGLASLGYATVALALYAIVARRTDWALFAAIALAGAVLALGPYLRVDGAVVQVGARPLPLPYIVFNRLPLMGTVRVPSRFILVTMVGVAVLAGGGAAALLERLRRTSLPRQISSAALVLLVGVIGFEYWPAPFSTMPVASDPLPQFFRQMGEDASVYAIADVPSDVPRAMFYQTVYDKPRLASRIARPKLHPWVHARFFGPLLEGVPPGPDIGADESAAAWHAALACQNVRYVVFYKQLADPKEAKQASDLEASLFGAESPAYEDDLLRAYGPLTAVAREAYWTPAEGEWYDAEANAEGKTYRWLKGESGNLLAYPCGSRSVTLNFDAYGFAQPRTLEVLLNGQLVQRIALPAETVQSFSLPLELREGENRITLRSVEPALTPAVRGFQNDERMIAINFSNVSMPAR